MRGWSFALRQMRAPSVDFVLEGWFAAQEDAAALVSRFYAGIAAFGPDAVDTAGSFAVLAEQYDTPRLRALLQGAG